MPPDANSETQRMTLEWCRNSPREMAPILHGMDAKLIGILATASVIISFVASMAGEIALDWTVAPFAVAVAAYLYIFGDVLRQIWPKTVEGPDDPRTTRMYWRLAPAVAIEHHWGLLEKAYATNSSVLTSKSRAIKVCVFLLVVVALALVVWIALAGAGGTSPIVPALEDIDGP